MLWVVVGRHWRPRGKRPGRASGGRPCVTRHGRHRASPTLHVTRKTRSRRLAVAPLHHGASRCTMEHHDATGVTTPRQTVKASPHRHKWMLSPGAPADPSDPWNSHAAPVSPRQNGQRLLPPWSSENSNPHDMDGVADHVGGAALAFGTSGHYAFFPVAAPCFWMKTFICSRSEVVADAGLNPRHAFRKSKS